MMLGAKPAVFIVDEETIIADTLVQILNQAGFKATAFDDAAEALAAASTECPDLLVTEVLMPKMSGMELACRIREAHPQCGVLFFSGQVGAADLLEKASKNGHTFELLRKPLHPTELIARLLEVANAKPELSSARPSKPLVDKCV